MDEFLFLIRVHATRSMEEEEGCLPFDIMLLTGKQDQVMLYEVYTSREAFSDHRRTGRYTAFLDRTEGMAASFPRIECVPAA